MNRGPLVLLILDGWGIAGKNPGNAIAAAKTPTMDMLQSRYPTAKLRAHGSDVGLPPGQEGNSEAGHINIGAGRIVEQDIVTISKSISTGAFYKNPAFESAYQHVTKNRSNLHLMGMITNGESGHSDPDHLLALLSWSRKKKIKNVYLHLFTDGRDSRPQSALKLVESLMRQLRNTETASGARSGEWIATIIGRLYAMDRKKDWARTKMAYDAMVMSRGRFAKSPQEAITQAYNRGETDEFILPYVIKRKGKPIATISDNDAVIFFNLRSDRARQLSKPFVQEKFNELNPGSFKRRETLQNVCFVAMTDFGPDLGNILTAYPSPELRQTLPMALSSSRQRYIAEKEKYAHVTYFFNGGYPDPVAGEDRVCVPSPDVYSYDKTPAMSVPLVAKKIIASLKSHDVVIANFSNPDMVGHTGNFAAAVKACAICDREIGKVFSAVKKMRGTLIVTADHGNVEEMVRTETGEKLTEHSKNPVPFVVCDFSKKISLKKSGRLADVAPTVLALLGVSKPREMSGKSLVTKHGS